MKGYFVFGIVAILCCCTNADQMYPMQNIPQDDPRFSRVLQAVNHGRKKKIGAKAFVDQLKKGITFRVPIGDLVNCKECGGFGTVFAGASGGKDGKANCKACSGKGKVTPKWQIVWTADGVKAVTASENKSALLTGDHKDPNLVTGKIYSVNSALANKHSLNGKVIKLRVEAKNSFGAPEEIGKEVYQGWVYGPAGHTFLTFKGKEALDYYKLARSTSRSSMTFYARVNAKGTYKLELIGRSLKNGVVSW